MVIRLRAGSSSMVVSSCCDGRLLPEIELSVLVVPLLVAEEEKVVATPGSSFTFGCGGALNAFEAAAFHIFNGWLPPTRRDDVGKTAAVPLVAVEAAMASFLVQLVLSILLPVTSPAMLELEACC